MSSWRRTKRWWPSATGCVPRARRLLGEGPPGQISQDDVAAYLAEHPGSRPGDIALALGVSSGRVSAHLYRGKRTRFVSRGDGWHLRPEKSTGGGS